MARRFTSPLDRLREERDRKAEELGDRDLAPLLAAGERLVEREVRAVLPDLVGHLDGDPAGMRALEIGCGPGCSLPALARTFGEVHAVDLSPRMLDLARRHVDLPNVTLHLDDGMTLRAVRKHRFHLILAASTCDGLADRAIVRYLLSRAGDLLVPEGAIRLRLGLPAWSRPEVDRLLDTAGLEPAGAREDADQLWLTLRRHEIPDGSPP